MSCSISIRCPWCGTRFSRRRHWLKHGKGYRCLAAQIRKEKKKRSPRALYHMQSFGTRTGRIEQ